MATTGTVPRLNVEQQAAVKWMTSRESGPTPGGGILADDVGKGKTFTAAGLIRDSPLWPTLVIVPKSTIWQWAGVLNGVVGIATCVLTSASSGTQLREVSRSRLVLASMGCVTGRVVPREIADRVWGRVMLDEAHSIRNPNTMAHKTLRALRAHAKWALTATPVHNSPADLLALARFVGFDTDDPEAVRHEIVLRRINGDAETVAAEDLKPSHGNDVKMNSVKMNSVLDVQTVHVTLTLPGERSLYDKVHDTFESAAKAANSGCIAKLLAKMPANDGADENKADDGDGCNDAVGKVCVFERLLRCRQAATHPGMYHRSMSIRKSDEAERNKHRECAADWAIRSSSKLVWLYNDLMACGQERSVVFCDWLDEMNTLEMFLEARGITTARFSGSLNVYERESVLTSFRRADGPRVLLMQVRSGACGLNLQTASRVYFMRPQWNPAVEYQAIGRVHRTGQKNDVVHVRRLVAVDTVDEAMDTIIQGKARSITSVMHDDILERCLSAANHK